MALYPNMTKAEIMAEFAQIVAPLIRKQLKEREGTQQAPNGNSQAKQKKSKKK